MDASRRFRTFGLERPWLGLPIVVALVVLLWRTWPGPPMSLFHHQTSFNFGYTPQTAHPISGLVSRTRETFAELAAQRTRGVEDAARVYRERRGRHPPPHFDMWVQWAEAHDATVSEWMFDQIYHDLEPFWALEPSKIRADAGSWPNVLTIRDGVVEQRATLPPTINNWIGRWQDLVRHIPAEGLPDVDLAFNPDDEPHIFVPWKDIDNLVEIAGRTRRAPGVDEMDFLSDYARYPPIASEPSFERFPDSPSEYNLWLLARDTCPPGSAAHTLTQDDDFSTPPSFPDPGLNHMVSGYVSNWTAAKSVCENPHLRNLYGYFVNPGEGSRVNSNPADPDRLTTRTLFPLLSPCKLQGVNNDILVPSPMYWGDLAPAKTDPYAWADKISKSDWRGGASGGFNNETNWTRFNRHRFVSMMNGTQVAMTVAAPETPAHVPGGDPSLPHNFPKPDPDSRVYSLAAFSPPSGSPEELGRWIDSFSSAAFVNLICHPPTDYFKNKLGRICSYTTPFYTTEAFDSSNNLLTHKYLPDVDGMSYSGRFLGFLESDSLPIKATVWSEWHDARLMPWKHFVPMDNTMMDWYAIMEFFVGYEPEAGGVQTARREGHDDVARTIADEGRQWARQVLRDEDMVLYFWRLILEYARICDDRRERLAYVDDLM